MTRDADFKAVVRARARRRGVPYAQARREEVARGPRREPATLHVTNGDSAAGTIRQTGVPGAVLAWRDTLHEGPVPAGSAADLRVTRARFLADWTGEPEAALLRGLERRDAELIVGHDRYVLWFEADLFDQLQVIQVIDGLAEAGVEPGRIELVSAGEFPGVAHFGGLGELSAQSLGGLYEQRVTLGSEAVALARQAWAAFRAPEPTALAGLAAARSPHLRFLGEAIGRLLQEYPWQGDGLSLTQRRILQSADGASLGEVFRRVWSREARPFQGDHVVQRYVRDLASCAHPLLEVDGEAVRLTEMGELALSGTFDHLSSNAPSRWIGGAQVSPGNAWRYDPRLESVERSPA